MHDNFFSHKLPKYMMLILVSYFAYFVFVQNFVVSSNLDFLSLRTVDDIGFQISLRTIHDSVSWKELLSCNDYGYGWIYWILMSVITYPAYLLQQASGVEWLLIVTPRMTSLFFALSSTYVFYKLVSIYTKNEWLKLAAIVLYPISVTAAYTSGSFHPTMMGCFFLISSVYFIAKEDKITLPILYKSLIVLAISFAIKLTNVIVAPIFILLVLGKYNFRLNKKDIVNLTIAFFVSAYTFFILLAPSIAIPLDTPLRQKSLEKILWAINHTSTGNISFMTNFTDGIINNQYYHVVFVTLSVLLILQTINSFVQKDKFKFDFIAYSLGYSIAIVFLSNTITHGTRYLFTHSLAISFVLPLSIVFFDSCKNKLRYIIIIIISLTLTLTQLHFILFNESFYNYKGYFNYFEKSKHKLELITELQSKILEHVEAHQYISIFIDYPLPAFFSAQKHDKIALYLMWDNLNEFEHPSDFIILDARRKNLLPQEEREKMTQHWGKEKLNILKEDYIAQNKILNSKKFLGKHWELIVKNDTYLIYKKIP